MSVSNHIAAEPARRAPAGGATLRAALPKSRRDPVGRMIAAGAAALVALSLIAAGTQPARADSDSDKILKALVGIGAIAIIANEIDKNDTRRAPPRYYDDRTEGRYDNRSPRYDDYRQPARGTRIPARCAIEIDAGRGRDATVFAESCLRREGVRAKMPRGCGYDIRVEGRRDRVYSEQCLRDAGLRPARGRY